MDAQELWEMLGRLRHARDISEQVHIEAQLNLLPVSKVKRLAAEHGVSLAPSAAIRCGEAARAAVRYDYTQAAALYAQGCSDNRIAEGTGIPVRSVRYWRKTRGLPSNLKRAGETAEPGRGGR